MCHSIEELPLHLLKCGMYVQYIQVKEAIRHKRHRRNLKTKKLINNVKYLCDCEVGSSDEKT